MLIGLLFFIYAVIGMQVRNLCSEKRWLTQTADTIETRVLLQIKIGVSFICHAAIKKLVSRLRFLFIFVAWDFSFLPLECSFVE